MIKKIDPEFKVKWLKALRSGEIAQAQGTLLNSKGAMCCIGVGIQIVGSAIPPTLEADDNNIQCELYTPFYSKVGIDCERDISCDLEEPSPWTTVAGKLIKMNDSGISFKDIADWIEKYL